MPKSDSVILTSSLKCSCGFYTSDAAHMRSHLLSSDCKPTGAHGAMILERVRAIAREREGYTSRIESLNHEEHELLAVLHMIEHPIVRASRPRLCNVCKKPTTEFFGQIPQCLKHTQGGAQVASILEGLLYGK